MNICRHCKNCEGTIRDSWCFSKGKKYSYYSCRECNTERMKKYRNTRLGRIASLEAVKRYCSKPNNIRKIKAHYALRRAVETGRIIKSLECSICRSSSLLHGHHDDYGRPLDVRWVCRRCHSNIHHIMI